jgi:putative phage-type endonuclease
MKNKIKIYDMEQRSDEWHEIRKGKLTASNASKIGTNGSGLKTYIIELMSKFYEGSSDEDYSNAEMERGVELEPVARGSYEMEKKCSVKEVGFIELNKYVGCSPDGLVGDDGAIEIKCHKNTIHFRLFVEGEKAIPTAYIWQCQMVLLITGRKWIDYVAYNPNFEKELLIFRIYPDKEKFEKLEAGIKVGVDRIKEIKKLWKK